MSKKLNALSLDTLPVGDHRDSIVAGLFLRVGVNRRTWYLSYYDHAGKRTKDKLGHLTKDFGLKAARDKANDVLDRVKHGVPVESIVTKVDGISLGELIDNYEQHRRMEGGRIKTLSAGVASVRLYLAAYLNLPARQFTKLDLVTVRDGIIKRGKRVAANRLLGHFGPIVRWAVERDHMGTNFVRDIKKSTETKRKVVLTDEEIRAVWLATFQMELDGRRAARSFARLIRFLLAVPTRKMEAGMLRVGDAPDGVWLLAKHKTDETSEIEHVLTLPQLARDQLGIGLEDLGNAAPDQLCFPGKCHGKPISGFSKLVVELRKLAAIEKHFTIHDLRRTGATRMQKLGIRTDHVDAVLNHAVKGVGGVYMHAEMTEQKAFALNVWATDLQRIIDGRPAKPVTRLQLVADAA